MYSVKTKIPPKIYAYNLILINNTPAQNIDKRLNSNKSLFLRN